MIEYLGHQLVLNKLQNITYLIAYHCIKCNLKLTEHKQTNYNNYTKIYYIVPTFHILEITCDEQIIKNIIE